MVYIGIVLYISICQYVGNNLLKTNRTKKTCAFTHVTFQRQRVCCWYPECQSVSLFSVTVQYLPVKMKYRKKKIPARIIGIMSTLFRMLKKDHVSSSVPLEKTHSSLESESDHKNLLMLLLLLLSMTTWTTFSIAVIQIVIIRLMQMIVYDKMMMMIC